MNPIRSALIGLGCCLSLAFAAPYDGDTLTLGQPDGTTVKAIAFGDEYYHRLESLDGFTLTQDPVTRWIEYARLDADGSRFLSTGVKYRLPAPGSRGLAASIAPAGLSRHADLKKEARQAEAARNRALLDREGRTSSRPGARDDRAVAALAAPLGAVRGLTLLVDFSDDVASIPQAEVNNYLNQVGYTGYSNNGSVRDYFFDVSGGKVTYTNHTTQYYRARFPKTHYTDPAIPYGQRARELGLEALRDLDARGFDFSTLSVDPNGAIIAINIFYAGFTQNNWSQGLWPHMSSFNFTDFVADGVHSGEYQITSMGSSLSLGTFCHENGHMVFDWPDLYDYDDDSRGLGNYCLMAFQGPAQNPVPPNAYFRSTAGWETPTLIAAPSGSLTLTHTANSNTHFRYNHPTQANEFFVIESRRKAGRNAGFPDEGLVIWHVDTYGSNSRNQMTPELHYQVSLEQADNLFELETNMSYGGPGDLFKAGYKTEFADWTAPSSKWWNGQKSGLNIVGIGPVGATMSFTVQPGELRTANVGNPALAGTLSESNGTVTMEGGGADIWGTADQFYYRYATLAGDGDLIARIQSLENTNAWAKGGIMLRESLDAGSRNAFLAVTPGNGTTFQQRTATNGTSTSTVTTGTAPRWLRLTRRGTSIQGFLSADGITWTAHGTANLAVTGPLLAGLAVTSHNTGALATMVATNFQVLPAAFNGADIGGATPAGSWSQNAGVLTVRGGGADIWNTSDQFYFMSQAFSGEGRIVARLNSLVQTDPSAKAGLMFRSGLGANAANVFVGVSAANGAFFQRRPTAGAATTAVTQAGIAAPRWLKLESRDGVLAGYRSDNGTNWTEIGREIAPPAVAYAGLAVTSHNTAQLTTAVFEQISVQRGFPSLSATYAEVAEAVGNMDGFINPGEEFTVTLKVANYGAADAFGVTATLSSADPCMTLLSAQGTFGTVPAEGESAASQTYRVRAGTGCASGQAPFSLAISDAYGDTWVSPFDVAITVSARLTGFVRTPAGPPPAGAYVTCFAQRFAYSGEVQPDGSYTITIPAGTYSCSAQATDYPTSQAVTLTFPPDRTQDFLLSRARIQVSRTSFAETLNPGQTRTVGFTVANPGDGTLEWTAANPQAGYLWTDSDSPGGPAYAWTDIRTTGTRLVFDQGMSGAVALRTLGFAFPFYGAPRSSLVVTRHGYVTFADHYPMLYNWTLPQDASLNGMIAGFWDEIGPTATAGAVYFQEFADRAVIQYDQVPRETGTGTYTFQIVLQRDGAIRFYYQTMSGADGATVGIQNATANRWISIVRDSAYVKNNLAVEIRPVTRDWLVVSPASGTTAPSGSSTLNATFDATGLAAGVYRASIFITHNDNFQGPLSLPVTLTVAGSSAGGLRREVWTGITGTAITSLTSHAAYPRTPNVTGTVSAFEAPQNYADNYGQRLRGFITPPTTGDYTFWIAGDDNAELKLSTDDHPGRAVVIARVSGFTGYRAWTAQAGQRSAAIRLEAGKKYYVEALHKEGTGGDHVSVGWQGPGITGEAERPIPAARLTPYDPAAWSGQAIGNPGLPGSQSLSGTVLSVTGGGADIWGTADQFRFAFRPLTGDGEITARVTSIQNTHAWAKAGVMIRESLAADSRHAFTVVSAASGLTFQRRTATAGTSVQTTATGAAPRWVRLRRAGNVFTSFVSTDGAAWTQLGTETIAMGAATWVGFAVTSHNNAVTTTATFESITAP